MNGGTVTVNLTLDDKQFNTAIAGAKSKATGFVDTVNAKADKISDFGKNMTKKVTLPIVGGFTLAAKSAIDFESRLADVSTLITGDSTAAVSQLKSGILDLTKTIPKSADDLGASAYSIVSAGISDTAQALKVLENSGKLATAGLSTTAEATDIMTSAINAFGFEAKDSDKVADILFKTVKAGKTDISQMAQAFGATAPIIAAAGVSLEEFSAATAALTTTGLPASQAQNSLRQAVVSLSKPTKEMTELFKKAGIESGEQALRQDGLQKTMLKLNKAAGGNAETLARAYGSVEALGAATGLTKTVSDAFTDTMGSMTDGSNAMEEAFAKQSATTGAELTKLKNTFSALAVEIGSQILPYVNQFASGLKGLAERFSSLSPESQKVVIAIAGIAAAIGPVLFVIGKLIKVATGAWKTLTTIAKGIGKAWRGVKFVTQWAVQFAKIIAHGAKVAAQATVHAVKAAAVWVAQAARAGAAWLLQFGLMIARAVAAGVAMITPILIAGAAMIAQAIAVGLAWLAAFWPVIAIIAAVAAAVFLVIKYWEPIKAFFAALWQGIINVIKAAIAFIGNVIKTYINIYIAVFKFLYNTVIGIFRAVANFVANVAGGIRNVFVGAVNRIKDTFIGLVNFVKELPGKIVRAIGNMGSLLYDKGRDLINGLLRGAGSLLSKIGQFFLEKLPSPIRGAFKKALGISSPSKVFAGYGKDIVEGLAQGVSRNERIATSAAGAMAQKVSSLGGNVSVPNGRFDISPAEADIPTHSSGNSTSVTVQLNPSGIVTRSPADLREVTKQMLRTVDEELRAKQLPQIIGGKLGG